MKQIFSILISLIQFQFIHLQTVPFRIRIVTWNVGNAKPDCNTFKDLAWTSIANNNQPDLIAFGFQETINKFHESYSFHSTLKDCLQNNNYKEIVADYVGSKVMKPIWLYIYVSNTQLQRVQLLKYTNKPTFKVYQNKMMETVIGYKGVIASRVEIDKLINIVFVNMHLPAGEGKSQKRCELWSKFFQTHESTNFAYDYMFAFGDQNWRTLTTLNIDTILKAIDTKNYQTILDNDELIQILRDDTTQCFSKFYEAPVTFPPSYKFIPNSDQYQTQKDNEDRRPSYTDRILVSSKSKDLKITQYSSMSNIKLSDHRPVFADINLHQQSQNDQTPKKPISNLNQSASAPMEQPSQKNPLLMIIMIIIITIICISAVFILYRFLIKPRLEQKNNPQRTSKDLPLVRSKSETTVSSP